MSGKLYVVGTPIGNLGDFSPRAVEVLGMVDFIAAEDTRVTLKLLNHFGIKKEMISYFEHNKRQRGEIIAAGFSRVRIVQSSPMPECLPFPTRARIWCAFVTSCQFPSSPFRDRPPLQPRLHFRAWKSADLHLRAFYPSAKNRAASILRIL